MAWEKTRTEDPDVKEHLVDAGWEVYHTVRYPMAGGPQEWRLRIDTQDLDQKAQAALPKNQGYDPFGNVDFASDAALELAIEKEFDAAAGDFDEVEPSGETGYTKADVESIIAAEDE